jgi:hypothetical protein
VLLEGCSISQPQGFKNFDEGEYVDRLVAGEKSVATGFSEWRWNEGLARKEAFERAIKTAAKFLIGESKVKTSGDSLIHTVNGGSNSYYIENVHFEQSISVKEIKSRLEQNKCKTFHRKDGMLLVACRLEIKEKK